MKRLFLFLALLPWLPGGAAAQAPLDNLLLSDHGARVLGFSSEFGSGWEAANLTPSAADVDPSGAVVRPQVWSSASMAEFPHWLLFDLSTERWITTLVFDNALEEEADHPGISAQEIEIWIGSAPDSLHKAAGFALAPNAREQLVRIEPVRARYLKLLIRSNHGHPWYTELGPTRAYDDGSRPRTLAAQLSQDGKAELYGLQFDFGSAGLREGSAALLDEIARYAQSHEAAQFRIEGHTDDVGHEDTNLALSQARAEAVRTALLARGVAETRMQAKGYGESAPIRPNTDAASRAANRRVTLRLAGTGID